jgi:hypothetical protein
MSCRVVLGIMYITIMVFCHILFHYRALSERRCWMSITAALYFAKSRPGERLSEMCRAKTSIPPCKCSHTSSMAHLKLDLDHSPPSPFQFINDRTCSRHTNLLLQPRHTESRPVARKRSSAAADLSRKEKRCKSYNHTAIFSCISLILTKGRLYSTR